MDGMVPNFKIGEAASNFFQNNTTIVDDSDSSFVVLAKDVRGSLRDFTFKGEQVLRQNLDDGQPILFNINEMENKLCHVLEENEKLKKTLEDSDNVIKEQYEKIEVWQKEVMTVCQDHKEKYMKSRELIDRVRAENEVLRGMLLNQSAVSKSSDIVVESSVHLNASIDKDPPLPQNDKLTKTIRTRDSSLDGKMTVISLKTEQTIQLPVTEMHCASSNAESVTAPIDSQKPATEMQCESSTAEMLSTDIHSGSSVNCDDLKNRLPKMLEEHKELGTQSKKLTTPYKDVIPLCNDKSKSSTETEKRTDQLRGNDCPSGIASEKNALQEDLIQEQESIKFKKLLSANHSSLDDMVRNRLQTCVNSQPMIFKDNGTKSSSLNIVSTTTDENGSFFEKKYYATIMRKLMTLKRVLKDAETTQTSATETQGLSSKPELITAYVETQTPIKETHCVSTETDARSTGIATDTAFKTQMFDIVPQFPLTISECYEQIEGLEKNAKQFLESRNLTKYVDAYKKSLKKLNNCFSSKHSPCMEEQNIVVTLHQLHKLQSDVSFIINELAIAMVEKANIKSCDTMVVEQENAELVTEKLTLVEQKISLLKEKALVNAKHDRVMILIENLKQEQEKLSTERRNLHDKIKKIEGDHQKQSYAVEKSMLEEEVLLLREKCTELTKKLNESNVLHTLKEDLSRERESLDELKRLLGDEMKSYQEEHAALTKENTLLKSKCDMLEVDVKNFNTELIDSHKTITKLRKKISELRDAADKLDVYKIQNDVQAKDILHLFEAEQNYLQEIERLSNEIEKVREANARFKNDS